MSMRTIDYEAARVARLNELATREAAKVAIPPVFVFDYIDLFEAKKADPPILFRYMFPIAGQLKAGLIFIERMNTSQKAITLRAELVHLASGQHVDFAVRVGYTLLKPAIPIAAGTRMALSFVNTPTNLEVGGIWIGFTYITGGILVPDKEVAQLELDENA